MPSVSPLAAVNDNRGQLFHQPDESRDETGICPAAAAAAAAGDPPQPRGTVIHHRMTGLK